MTTEEVVRGLYRGKNGGLASVAELRWCKPTVFALLPAAIQEVANRYIRTRSGDSAGRAVLKDWLVNNTEKQTT